MLLSPILVTGLFIFIWSNDDTPPSGSNIAAPTVQNQQQPSVGNQGNEIRNVLVTPGVVSSQNTGLINLQVQLGRPTSEEKIVGFWNSPLWTGALPLLGVFITMLFAWLRDRRVLETAAQAERRMGVETLIKWVQLTSNGKDLAPLEQRTAALLVLAKSGFVEMAITQLDSIWKRESLDAGTAVSIIDEGFRYTVDQVVQHEKKMTPENAKSEVKRIQDLAAMTLEYHAARLSVGQKGAMEFYWPNQVEWQWKPELSDYAQVAIWQALVTNLVTHPFKDWHEASLRGAFVSLHAVMKSDRIPFLQYATAELASGMLERFKGDGIQLLVASDHKYHPIDVLLSECEQLRNEFRKLHGPVKGLIPRGVEESLANSLRWCQNQFPQPKPAIMTM